MKIDNHSPRVSAAEKVLALIEMGHDQPMRLTLTPDDARKLYELGNPKNRRQRPQKVETYTKDMAMRSFMYTGQALIFSVSGLLLDGHHRLHALSEAPDGVEVEFNIAFGVADEAVTFIDIGAKRTNADMLRLEDYKNPEAIAAIAGGVASLLGLDTAYHHLRPTLHSDAVVSSTTLYYPIKDRKLMPNPAAFVAASVVCGTTTEGLVKVLRQMGPRYAALGATLASTPRLRGADHRAEAADFFRRVGTGTMLQEGTAAYTLRATIHDPHFQIKSRAMARMAVGAFAMHLLGQTGRGMRNLVLPTPKTKQTQEDDE